MEREQYPQLPRGSRNYYREPRGFNLEAEFIPHVRQDKEPTLGPSLNYV